jgi:hypothetical protein
MSCRILFNLLLNYTLAVLVPPGEPDFEAIAALVADSPAAAASRSGAPLSSSLHDEPQVEEEGSGAAVPSSRSSHSRASDRAQLSASASGRVAVQVRDAQDDLQRRYGPRTLGGRGAPSSSAAAAAHSAAASPNAFTTCHTCDALRPPRAHHCHVCDRCVLKVRVRRIGANPIQPPAASTLVLRSSSLHSSHSSHLQMDHHCP